ncbi:MAG TPA: tRNA (guanosine(46)-N7)-methyltransferase TrmB [Candidatus Competibacter sp.]|nr:tRNA (guanosine(46)-N7)-methyltransferase TrmB [Candidatus Competibacter sp.]
MHSADHSQSVCEIKPTFDNPDNGVDKPRHIKSFVRREGRITAAQQRALAQLWERFGLEVSGTFEPEQWFGRQAPLVLEIGFGDGESLATMCAANPCTDFIGIEVHRPGIGHLLLRAAELGLTNLRLICLDAVEVLQQYLPDECLDRVQIFFPDPWPKTRHHKRRLIQPVFVSLLAKKIKSTGLLHIATDCENYAYSILEVLRTTPELQNIKADNGFAECPAYRPTTKFEQRGKRLGHPVWEILFTRHT